MHYKTLDECFEEWNTITDKWFDFGTFVDWLKKDGWRIV